MPQHIAGGRSCFLLLFIQIQFMLMHHKACAPVLFINGQGEGGNLIMKTAGVCVAFIFIMKL